MRLASGAARLEWAFGRRVASDFRLAGKLTSASVSALSFGVWFGLLRFGSVWVSADGGARVLSAEFARWWPKEAKTEMEREKIGTSFT